MSKRNVKADAQAEAAARMFSKDNMSYGKIAAQLGITKAQAKAKVRTGLQMTPQLARQIKE